MAGKHIFLSDSQWAQVRAAWEADPRMSYAEAGSPFGVGKGTVFSRAKTEGWQKRALPAELAKAAHAAADTAVIKAVDKNDAKLGPEIRDVVNSARAAASARTEPSPEQVEAAQQAAIDLRAKLIERHRSEWSIARRRVYEAANGNDFEKAKLGKITSEALKIIQDGERKAWGIDAGGDEKEVKVVIERSGGGGK